MTFSWQIHPKALAKDVLYRTGVLGALHGRRNPKTLSVLMFHRVIAPDTPAWQGANPLFTMSTGFFEQLLGLIRRHYNPVGLEAVALARRGEAPLPPRALLVTFDDGWADNVEFAAPLLSQAGVPAVFFVATGAVKAGVAFWQERLFACLLAAGEGSEHWRALEQGLELPPSSDKSAEGRSFPRRVMQLVSRLESLSDPIRQGWISQMPDTDADWMPRMMTPEDIADLARDPLFDFGTHGVSHTPFPALGDPVAELVQSWEDLSTWCTPAARSLSFPHGQYTDAIRDQAISSGYELIFDSEKILNEVDGESYLPVSGRFEVRPPGSDPFKSDYGRYSSDKFDAGRIAAEMFFRPINKTPVGEGQGGDDAIG